jgi:REP element-mobilizing transposase RayT
MARTYTKLLIHCVYSTKHRRNSIREPERVWGMTREIARNLKIDVIAIGGTRNHIHLLLALPSNRNLADVLRELKSSSSLILREADRQFRWQDGYGAISVSPAAVPAVIRYIENQELHHRDRSFETEYLEMLNRAGIEYVQEYVLD